MEVKSTQAQASEQTVAASKAKKKAAVASDVVAGASTKVQGKEQNHYDVALSPEARRLSAEKKKAYELAKNTPEVREERVRALKEKIANGSYQVDAGQIADGMLREAIKEQLATSGE